MAYTFRDPLEATEDLRRSPVHEHMQLSVVRQEQGVAILSSPLTENLGGLAEGSIHGGMLATLADAASAFCLEGSYEPGSQIPVTTDMHIRYYRQPQGGPLVAEATMVHRGRRLLSLRMLDR
ncbi:MAG: PaaI family thioesterase [Mycobacterium sp.]